LEILICEKIGIRALDIWSFHMKVYVPGLLQVDDLVEVEFREEIGDGVIDDEVHVLKEVLRVQAAGWGTATAWL
jgi:hypothetical protein